MSVSLDLTQIYTGASASLSNRWSFCSFLDKAVFAHGSIRPKYWPGFGLCMDLPGLPLDTRWDGVLAYQGHLMGFQGSTLTWSDVNDFTNFIPVANTIQDIALTLANNFTQLAPGVETDWVFVNESTYGMVPEMFVRLDYPPYYNFYTVNAVSLVNNVSGTSAGYDQNIIPGRATDETIWLTTYTNWASATTTPGATTPPTADTIGFIEVKDSGHPLQVIGQGRDSQLAGVITSGFTAPAINNPDLGLSGTSVTVQLIENPGWVAGDFLSLGGDGTGDAASLALDIYQITNASAGISNYISGVTSSSSSPTVNSTASSLPSTLVIGSTMLGQQVISISGTSGAYVITLNGNADVTITAGLAFYTSAPTITMYRIGSGTSQKFAYAPGTNAVLQPYVTVLNTGSSPAFIPAGSTIVEAYGLKLTLEDLTGVAPAGSTFIGGSQILSLNANEAGQLINAGDRINGPIWAMSTSGLYAVIMKERSFQSISYVGTPGIFNIWPEFTDEGLGRIRGAKSVKTPSTSGGIGLSSNLPADQGDPTPIGQKQFVQVLAEIDLTRVSEACMYHKEDRREVWFVYPVQGYDPDVAPSRVFVYNYEQGSISVDDYADEGARITEDYQYERITNDGSIRVLESVSAQSPITAVGSLPVYTTALRWEDWTGEWRDQLIAWNELTGGRQFLTLMAFYPDGTVNIGAHGGDVYNRNGEAIFSSWTTVDHDGGDEEAFKYVDLVQFSLAVDEVQQTRPFRLYVQVGVKPNFDTEIVWSTPQWVDCAGNGNYATKKNFNMCGRFTALRFFSDQANSRWRIASYTISGRLGGTY